MECTLDGILLHDPGVGTLVPARGTEPGPALAVLFVRSGVGGVEHFPIEATTVRLGRAPDNDIVLVAPSVSPSHAELRLRGGLWLLTDLGSGMGSQVDGVAVQGSALLAPGSELRLGDVCLAFDPQDRWEDSPSERAPVVAPVTPATVHFREASSPFVIMPEPEAPSRRGQFITAAVVVAIATLLYFLLQAR